MGIESDIVVLIGRCILEWTMNKIQGCKNEHLLISYILYIEIITANEA